MIHIDRTERTYIIISIALLLVFATAIAISSFAYGIQVPLPVERVDPKLITTPGAYPAYHFGDPVEERIRELAPGRYEAYIVAQTWAFLPNRITVPKGSTITFYVTSKDVIHGLKLDGTNINMMIIPGEISRLTATFDDPGTYNFVCHEYCGAGHHTMYGQLTVEE